MNHTETTKRLPTASNTFAKRRRSPSGRLRICSLAASIEAASTRPARTAAGISGNGISANFTLRESPPFASIHARTATSEMLLSALTATVFPLRSFAPRSGELLRTVRIPAVTTCMVCRFAGATIVIGNPRSCATASETTFE